MSVPQLAQVSARTEDPHPGLCSVSFHAVHWLSMSRPTILLSVHPFATVSAVTLESHYFLFLGVLALAVPFLLVLATLALTFALATFAISLACHGVNVHWLWSKMIWSPLPTHCQKRLNGCTNCRISRQGFGH